MTEDIDFTDVKGRREFLKYLGLVCASFFLAGASVPYPEAVAEEKHGFHKEEFYRGMGWCIPH